MDIEILAPWPQEGENEAQLEAPPIPMGQPDPNNGPRRTDWSPLLDAQVSLYHVKDRSQPPLPPIPAILAAMTAAPLRPPLRITLVANPAIAEERRAHAKVGLG